MFSRRDGGGRVQRLARLRRAVDGALFVDDDLEAQTAFGIGVERRDTDGVFLVDCELGGLICGGRFFVRGSKPPEFNISEHVGLDRLS